MAQTPQQYQDAIMAQAYAGDTAAQKSASRFAEYTGPRPGSGVDQYSKDPNIRQGQVVGISRGQQLYGQGYGETGSDIQGIKRMREESLHGDDPVSTYMRQSGNRQIRQTRAAAGAAGRTSKSQEAQIRRSSESDIASQMSQNRSAALSHYQSLIGNISKNLHSLDLGWAGVEKSGSCCLSWLHLAGYSGSEVNEDI